MEHSCFIVLLLQLLSYKAQGTELSKFLEKYKTAIDTYVMAGYGEGWNHCDVVTDYYHEGDFLLETVPQLVMGLEKLQPSEKNTSSGNFLL